MALNVELRQTKNIWISLKIPTPKGFQLKNLD